MKLGVFPLRRTIVQFEEFKGESLFSAALSIMKVSFDDNLRREQKVPELLTIDPAALAP